MKQIFKIIILLLVGVSFSFGNDSTFKDGYVTSSYLNARVAPNLNATIKKVYQFGNKVNYKKHNDNWLLLNNSLYVGINNIKEAKSFPIKTVSHNTFIRNNQDLSIKPLSTIGKNQILNAIGFHNSWFILENETITSCLTSIKIKKTDIKNTITPNESIKSSDLNILTKSLLKLIESNQKKDNKLIELENRLKTLEDKIK